jgi:nickel transport protein
LLAGAWHRNEWRLAAEEFTAGPATAPPPRSAAATESAPPSTSSAADAGEITVTLSSGELQALIEASLEKKLAPIMQRLRPVALGPSLSDIIGGLGYILGLVGLASYLHSRRKSG